MTKTKYTKRLEELKDYFYVQTANSQVATLMAAAALLAESLAPPLTQIADRLRK